MNRIYLLIPLIVLILTSSSIFAQASLPGQDSAGSQLGMGVGSFLQGNADLGNNQGAGVSASPPANATAAAQSSLNASLPIGIYFQGQLYDTPNSTVIIHLPITTGGQIGINGGTSINFTFLENTTSPITVTYSDKVGASAVLPTITSASKLAKTITISSLKIGTNITISISAPGHDPQIIIVPTPIVAYLPITLQNNQPTAVTNNAPLIIGVSNNAGNIIGFNAIKYQAYETPNLSNIEYFYSNGTLISSFLNGNQFNMMAANQAATSVTSTNALSNSGNIIWTVVLNSESTLLPANTGIPSTYTIYMGFTGKTPTSANNLFTNTINGEAPQLSCDQPWATNNIGCTGTEYDQYDNGNYIYGLYYNGGDGYGLFDSFKGTTINSANWAYTANVYVNNGVMMDETGYTAAAQITSKGSWNPQNAMIDTLEKSPAVCTFNCYFESYGPAKFSEYYFFSPQPSTTTLNNYNAIIGNNGVAISGSTSNQFNLMSIWANTASSLGQINYYAPGSNNKLGFVSFPLAQAISTARTYPGNYVFDQYIYTTLMPNANDVLPSTTFGSIETLIKAVTLSSPSNAIIDAGQYQSFTATVSGGTQPFTFSFNAINSISTGTITNTLIASGINSQSYTWTYYINPYDVGNSLEEANVVVTDASGYQVNSLYSTPYSINSMLVANAPIASNVIIDLVQYSLQQSQASGGTLSYSYQWYSNTIGAPACNPANIISGATSANYLANPLLPGTYYYAYSVTDSASTPNTQCSTADNVIVNPYPAVTSIVPSNPTYNLHQTVSELVTWYGGSASFTGNWIFYSAGTPIAYYSFNTVTGNSNTVTFPAANFGIGTYTFNVIITDSDPAGAITFNSLTNTLTINNNLAANAITPASPSIDTGQSITLTSHASGGAGGYTYQWYTSAGCTSAIGGATGVTYYTGSLSSTTTYYYKVTDSIGDTACSAGNTVTVKSTITITVFNALNNPQGYAEQQVLTAIISGGVPPYSYTYNVFNPSSSLTYTATYTGNYISSNAFGYLQGAPLGSWTGNVYVSDSSANGIESATAELTYVVEKLPVTYTCVSGYSNTLLLPNASYVVKGQTLTLLMITNSSEQLNVSSNNIVFVNVGENNASSLMQHLTLTSPPLPSGSYFEMQGSNIITSEACTNIGSGGGTINENNNFGITLPGILLIFSIILFLVHFIPDERETLAHTLSDVLAIALMFFAIYFYLFAANSIGSIKGTSITSNITTTFNITVIQGTPTIPINNYPYIMLISLGIAYMVICVIFAIQDFVMWSRKEVQVK